MGIAAGSGVMQAFRIHEGGEGRFEEAPDPVAGGGEVLVELRAAALNRRDILVRNPPGPAYDFPKPFVAGHDGAGVRRDTGEEVVLYPGLDWGPSDDLPGALRWLGGPLDGTFAELIAVPEENVFPKPARLSWEEAAALPVAGMTAWRALHSIGEVAPGQTVLVLGAGSGVSTFAVALAAQAGARVLVTSSSEEKIERARELGAEGGVLYTEDDWAAAVREQYPTGSTWSSTRWARRGRTPCVRCAGAGGSWSSAAPAGRRSSSTCASSTSTTSRSSAHGASPREFGRFLETVAAGSWRPVVDSVRPLAEAEAGYERLAADHYGKVVLSISTG